MLFSAEKCSKHLADSIVTLGLIHLVRQASEFLSAFSMFCLQKSWTHPRENKKIFSFPGLGVFPVWGDRPHINPLILL